MYIMYIVLYFWSGYVIISSQCYLAIVQNVPRGDSKAALPLRPLVYTSHGPCAKLGNWKNSGICQYFLKVMKKTGILY